MKSIYILFYFVLFSHISFSQKIPNKYKKYFKNCCNPKTTNIRSLIEIDGFFKMGLVYLNESQAERVDTFFTRILFYEDGFKVSAWGGVSGQSDNEFLIQVDKNGAKDYFYKNAFWGQYQIRNDTIVTRSILPGTFMRATSVEENIYKVINRTTILLVGHSDLTNLKANKNNTSNIQYLPANFIYSNIIPVNKHSWLRNQKCISCNSID
jgi:hypothetical protein